jgi:hypothetical protein
MKKNVVYGFVFLACLITSGGSDQQRRLRYVNGLSPIIDAQIVKQSTTAQHAVFDQLLKRAGLCTTSDDTKCTPPPDGSAEWGKFVEAGFGFIDEQCEQYLDALFWYNRYRNATSQHLALTGGFTSSILGIAEASAKSIAITAAAFGFSSTAFDNLSGTVLFDLDPSAVKNLVDRSRAQYRAAVQARSNNLGKETATTAIAPLATNRPDAMSLIQGYLSLCLPASIETQVNNAVASTDFEVDPATKGSLIPTLRRVDIHTRNQIQLENNIQNRNQFESGNRIGRINAQTQLEPEKPYTTAIKNAQT